MALAEFCEERFVLLWRQWLTGYAPPIPPILIGEKIQPVPRDVFDKNTQILTIPFLPPNFVRLQPPRMELKARPGSEERHHRAQATSTATPPPRGGASPGAPRHTPTPPRGPVQTIHTGDRHPCSNRNHKGCGRRRKAAGWTLPHPHADLLKERPPAFLYSTLHRQADSCRRTGGWRGPPGRSPPPSPLAGTAWNGTGKAAASTPWAGARLRSHG